MLYTFARRGDRSHEITALAAGMAWTRPWHPRVDEQLQASITRALALGRLAEFRRRLYGSLTGRADALFELADAVLAPTVR